MKKKKQRIPVISPHFDEHVEIGGLDISNGIFTFKDSNGNKLVPTSVTIGDSYTKESGKPKILNQIEADNDQINLNPNVNLEQFDWLFAIDTNTKQYNESKISISCAVFSEIDLNEPKLDKGVVNQDWHAKVIIQSAFLFRNSSVNPELVGWQELVNRIKKSPEFNNNLEVGIVVDSELDKLSRINRREIPIIGEHYLPDNFQLIYASADSGAEYPHNKLIKICDTTGNKIWNYVLDRDEVISNMESIDNLFIDGSTTLSSEIVYELSGHAT